MFEEHDPHWRLDNKEVTQQSDCINGQEQNKEGTLHLRVICKTKNKFSYSGVIFPSHILDEFLSKKQSMCIKGDSLTVDTIIKMSTECINASLLSVA